MAKKDDFLRELRATFRIEAGEHLQAISSGLEQLEKTTQPSERQPLIETVFRAAHSLKGAARAVDFGTIESQCQSLESLFAAWKRGTSEPDASALDSAHLALGRMMAALGDGPAAANTAAPPREDSAAAAPVEMPIMAGETPETVRISVRTLDQRLLEAEELLAAKLSAAQRTSDLDDLQPLFEAWRKEWTRVQPEARALRHAKDATLADFFDWNLDWLRSLEARVASLRRQSGQDKLHVEKLVDNLLENSKKLLMLPFGTLTGLLRKLVRDLARELGKDAELAIHGEETCVDKRVLEEMKDPLVHLLRNSLDHGIESPAQRAIAGKRARAVITVAVRQVNGSQVEIAVGDDGAGIDVDAVRAQAVARGILNADAAKSMDAAAVLPLVFATELSTSPMITELSGRGLGLAIVREKAEKLGGRVAIESERGLGTTLRMTLPLTLATFRGVLVESARRTFVVPTAQIERVLRFRASDVRTVEGRETIAHDGRALALAHLTDVLDLPLPAAANDAEAQPALILSLGGDRIAFAVDAVIDEREVLVKRLHKPLVHVRNIAGATVLGSGQVSPILNVGELLQSARAAQPRVARAARLPARAESASPVAAAKRVLVAEDSITSRMLLRGILESAGYDVKTAVDGLEAFTLLRTESFDVLVSDVEMPRLDGFALTERVRADRRLTELPVVLVTALASREHRERGVEVGANAYLVKSDLDQSNLLEAVRRLA
jgi:two-component system chemotaxis sensor kinase CheA